MRERYRKIVGSRRLCLLCFLLCSVSAWCNGGVDYSSGAQGLSDMATWVGTMMMGTRSLLFVVGAILAVYSATVIFIKVNQGEGGFTKPVMMLVGACVFLTVIVVILPAFFGYNYGVSSYSFSDMIFSLF